MLPLGKVLENGLGIIADGRQADALVFKSLLGLLQLHELHLAEGSPVCRAEKQQDRPVLAQDGAVALLVAKLVTGLERGRDVAHRQPHLRLMGIRLFWPGFRQLQSASDCAEQK